MSIKILVISVAVSLITSLVVFWGYNRYQNHRKWLVWKQEQNKIQKFQEETNKRDRKFERMYERNLITIIGVKFVNENRVLITGKLPPGSTVKRAVIATNYRDDKAYFSPSFSTAINKDRSFSFEVVGKPITYEANEDGSPCKGHEGNVCPRTITTYRRLPTVQIFVSHFLSKNEILPGYLKSPTKTSAGVKDGRWRYTEIPSQNLKNPSKSITIEKDNDVIYEVLNGENASSPDLYPLYDPERPLEEYLINSYLEIVLDPKNRQWCYYKGGYNYENHCSDNTYGKGGNPVWFKTTN